MALGCTVQELLDRISARELTEWMAFYKTAPFGDERGDIQAAVIASTIVQMLRDPHKGRKPRLTDFMPVMHMQKPVASADLLLAKAIIINKAMGGRDIRPRS